jgi:beta-lactamase superfamily II metal-dependent hydrolase
MHPQNYQNFIEFVLIGTGGDYGESILVNVGNNNWIVVDSCVNPNTRDTLPLEYLKNIGVNFSTDVKMIICTHWHDDHIRGISKLYKECTSAKFCLSIAKDQKKFLQLVKLDYQKVKSSESISSTVELTECLKIKKDRNANFVHAVQDKTIFSHSDNGITSQVITLSPSEQIIEDYDNEISVLMTEYAATNRKIIDISPNDKSVVVLIKINEYRILLGSDLEVNADKKKGWYAILDDCQSLDDKKAKIFKIPHHGSENGYDKRIWEELVDINAISGITPFNRGKGLPTKEMLKIYLSHTVNLYITSYIGKNKPKKRKQRVSKAIENFNRSLRELRYNLGIVKCRINLKEENPDWQIEVIENAFQVNHELL